MTEKFCVTMIFAAIFYYSAATTAFGISTLVLAVQKAELGIDLNSCRNSSTQATVPTDSPKETTSTATESISTVTEPITTEEPLPENMTNYRLPTHVIPISYDLTINPNLKDGLFTGKVIVKVDVKEETKNIKLHSNKLKILNVKVNDKDAKNVLDDKYELLVISLKDDAGIATGKHTISIEYSGNMTDGIVGLYKSTYIGEDGKSRDIATSKFEPTYARQAFPCFDEPGLKATYTVHILKPKTDPKYIALSNMPEVGNSTHDDGVLVTFQESVRMSTYLTCFIVCDFEYESKTVSTENGPIDLKVYATPAQLAKTKYAASVAEGVLAYFVKYFKYKYPLPKLDLIAIPDFVSGAMEHWGLVTFRETALLYDEEISSTINKQRVATVISHELAHSWFGNLVTMSWWNDLWLNEGFASYIQYKGVADYEKDWQMMDQFIIETLHPVLSIDALSSSHPIIKTVITPDQITEIFDTITYNKGASILRMLEDAVSEEKFREAVQNYLKKHAFENAITQDLLDELKLLLKDELNVEEFMDTWTKQPGYPIITIVEKNGEYTLTQKRFLKNSAEEIKSDASLVEYSWTIPVTYITSEKNDKPELKWFNSTEKSLVIPISKDITWVKFNHKQVGYYRVNYPEQQWKNLLNVFKNLSISDKTHLLEESFSIAESSELSYEIPLDMTTYLDKEKEYIPWSVASTKLIQLNKYLDSTPYFKYLDYIMKLAEPLYEEVGWEQKELINQKKVEDHLTKRKRITILGLLCSVEHDDCLKEASKRLDDWFKDKKKGNIPQDLRSIVYKYGMVYANRKKWEDLLEAFKEEIDANEKINMMRGLAAVKNPDLLMHLIELGKTEEVIRGQDYFSMLTYVSDNSVGTPIVWDYVRENWEELEKRFTLNDRNLGKLIPAITSSFTTTMRLNEMKDFFEKYPNAGAGKAARTQALETVQANIKWIGKNKKDVEAWIEKLQK